MVNFKLNDDDVRDVRTALVLAVKDADKDPRQKQFADRLEKLIERLDALVN